MTPVLSTLLPFASLSAQGAAASPTIDRLVAIVEQAVPEALERHDAPGVAVSMVVGHRVAWTGGFGYADAARGTPVRAGTAFEVASVTKAVTAWGVLKLAEQGRLDLDAPIDRYLTRWHLPPSEFDHSRITARAILAHAAGLSGGGDPGVEPGQPVPTLEEAANGASMEGGAIRVATPPGDAFHYSSKGYLLLEMMIEDVTGERFADYMKREILEPLAMANSDFEWTPALAAGGAVGHDWYGNPLPRYGHATNAQGGLVSTAGDLAVFLAATMRGPGGEPPGRGVLTPTSVAATFTPWPYSNDAAQVGLGYNLHTGAGALVARKTGDQRGWKSIVFVVPDSGLGLVILSNSDRAAAGVFADIACPWSEALPGHPLREVCGQMRMFRNAQLGAALLLVAVVLAYGGTVVSGLRRGRRQVRRRLSRRGVVRVTVLSLLLGTWWVFWYTDLALRLMGYPRTFVTVRFDPWPTAFIWVSWSVTLLVLAAGAATFLPRTAQGPTRSSLASSRTSTPWWRR